LVIAAKADLDMDGDVDEGDYQAWSPCLLGPSSSTDPDCQEADLDEDADVDLRDAAEFQRAFTAAPCVVLHIDEQPLPSNNPCGTSFSVSVEVSADPPAHYQWFIDDEPIPGATEPVYFVASATNADHGYYHCRVENTCGVRLSNTVLVRVFPNPCP
jgi:hypothetical protein